MRIFWGKSLLLMMLLVGSAASADDQALLQCNNSIEGLLKDYKVSTEGVLANLQSDKIRQCMENFLKANEGANFVSREKDECGMTCGFKKWWSSDYGAEDFTKTLEENLKAKEIIVLEHYNKEYKPLLKRVETSLDAYNNKLEEGASAQPESTATDTYEALKYILNDLIGDYVRAEIEEMGVDLNSENRSEATAVEVSLILKELRSCFVYAKTQKHIETCTAKFKKNAPYKVGGIVIGHYLDTYFKKKFEAKSFSEIEEAASMSYANCGMLYYFNDDITAENLKKIKSCSYIGLLSAFSVAVEKIISQFVDLSDEDLNKMTVELKSRCREAGLFDEDNPNRAKRLGEKTPEEFQGLLLSCQDVVTKGAISKIGVLQISSHESVKAVVPDLEERKKFAESAIKRGVPTCLKVLPEGMSPEMCENIIFSISAEDLFEKVLLQEIELYKEDYEFLKDVNLSEVVAAGVAAVRLCHEDLYKDIESFLQKDRSDAELDLAKCTRKGIVAALDRPIEGYLNQELDWEPATSDKSEDGLKGNKVLRKYDIRFEEEDKELIKDNFKTCAEAGISAEKGFSSVIESAKTFLTPCVLATTKSVILDSADLILYKELHRMGFKPDEIRTMVKEYKESSDSVFSKIEGSETNESLQALLLTADKEIIKGIAGDVIELLIKQKTPVSFSRANMRELIKEGKRSLFKCIKSKEITACTDSVEVDVMAMGIRIFLPEEAASVTETELKPWFKGSNAVKNRKMEGLNLRALYIRRINSTSGYNISRDLARKMLDKKNPQTVAKLKKDKKLREFVYEAINSSPRHMLSISYYLIQPQIEQKAANYGLRSITRKKMQRALDWRYISKTSSGKAAMRVFKKHFKRVVVESAAINMKNVEKEMSGLLRNAYSEYRKLIKKYCVNKNADQCAPIMDQVDKTL